MLRLAALVFSAWVVLTGCASDPVFGRFRMWTPLPDGTWVVSNDTMRPRVCLMAAERLFRYRGMNVQCIPDGEKPRVVGASTHIERVQ